MMMSPELNNDWLFIQCIVIPERRLTRTIPGRSLSKSNEKM
jgi:hypothetical protein